MSTCVAFIYFLAPIELVDNPILFIYSTNLFVRSEFFSTKSSGSTNVVLLHFLLLQKYFFTFITNLTLYFCIGRSDIVLIYVLCIESLCFPQYLHLVSCFSVSQYIYIIPSFIYFLVTINFFSNYCIK